MEEIVINPNVPRYSHRPLPPYRYRPFRAGTPLPHPRIDPDGHSYDQEEDYLADFKAEEWRTCEPYLYGIDLFNHGYWWEAHDAWEIVWHAAGSSSRCGLFIQGLIQLAGAQLKRAIGEPAGARSLTAAANAKLGEVGSVYLGIQVTDLIAAGNRCLEENRGEYPCIVLRF